MTVLPQNLKPIEYTIPIGLAGSAYVSYSPSLNNQTCINWRPILGGPDSSTPSALFPTHGVTQVTYSGSGIHRGAIEHLGKGYFVIGNRLIEMDTNENFTTISGNLSTSTGRVSMASNGNFGNQIIIVDGTNGYIFDGVSLTTITDPDFPAGPRTVKYMDGVAILTVDNSGAWYICETNDFSDWVATRFANAERDPDNLISNEVNNRDIMLFGQYTTEVGLNNGGNPFPFEVYANGLFDKGIAARFSVAKANDFVFWLSRDRTGAIQVLKAKGTSYTPVSSQALDQLLSTYDTVSDAEAFCYSEKGTIFYQITFPTEGTTFVYNLSINNPELAWFQKKSGTTRHLASTYIAFNGQQYIGDYASANIYKLDATSYKEGSAYIIRERTSGTIRSQDNRKSLIHRRLEIIFETGTGLVTGQGSAPQVALDWSDDGGRTWSNTRTQSLGGIGEYSNRVIFNTLGMAYHRIYRVRVSDPVKWVLLEGYLNVEETSH